VPAFCVRKVRIALIAYILALAWVLCGVSTPALAFDLKIRELFQNKVESSDRFINDINTKADGAVNKVSAAVTFYTKEGFSTVEKLTGLSTQNQLYGYSKNNWLKTIGFGLGVLEGTKDFAVGTVSLLAYLESSPARAVTLAYNVQERPLEYKEKVISGGKTVATILANPGSLVGGIYQWGKNTYVEARQDPLKYGQLQGEVATFGATLLLGGGQIKVVTSTNKAINMAKTSSFPRKIVSYASTPVLAATTGKSTGIPPIINGVISKLPIGSKATKYPFEVEKLNGILTDPAYSWIRNIREPVGYTDDLSKWGVSNYKNWRIGLLPEEKEAIKNYSNSFELINFVLRYDIKENRARLLLDEIGVITRALKKAEVPEPILVFRGTTKDALGRIAHLHPEELIGKTFTEKAFMSTSLLPLKRFVDPVRGLHMVIKVPKGANGAHIGPLSNFPFEEEILFPPGQKMIIKEAMILKDQEWSPGGLQIVVELM
jgi:hypothetical protein